MSCENDCRQPVAFPKVVFNRPGLSTIDYRIGSYADLREHMLSLLDASPALAEWTHRLPDDPGIALIEAAAEVGDILSFYQDLYANEAYLRSAKWRDSVADLVRLLGYRLAPGIGGRARFAFAVKGTQPVLLPKGLGIKAQLEGDDKPAVFETSAELLAQPALSQFHLYRPRVVPNIHHGTDTFTLVLGSGASVALKAGDRVMVGVPRASGNAFDHLQVLVVDKTWESFGSTVVKMKGGVTSLKKLSQVMQINSAMQLLSSISSSASMSIIGAQVSVSSLLAAGVGLASLTSTPQLQAWKLGGTHRHFGHNAPATQVSVNDKGRATVIDVPFLRRINATTPAPAVPSLSATQMPLDGEVASIVAGTRVLIEANLYAASNSSPRKRLLERRIAQVDRQSLAWGPLTGASTVLSLDESLAIVESNVTMGYVDIRGTTFHEVVGEPFQLHADFSPSLATKGHELHFYGSATEAQALAKRGLLMAGPGDALVYATALSVEAAGIDANQSAFHRVQLDRECSYAQFGHEAPQVTVYGNLIDATQGKTESQIALGDGDGRAVFQTFALPKTPLTYLLDTTQVPAQLPQLHVWVDGIEWTHVDSLFGRGPKERVYIVREDAEGQSWVQFGDGKTGSRLRTGRGNVVAIYRTGDGAHGPLKADAKPQADKKPATLDKVFMLEPVTGGAQAESMDGARQAAPGTMQSLGRIVSVADYEAEALSIPGVIKARAAWTSVDGSPLVRVTILTDSASQADATAAADALRAAVRTRGAGRCPLLVVQGTRTQIALTLVVGHESHRRADDVRAAILTALGATGEEGHGIDSSMGLFSWQHRQFGESAHGSQVVGAVQNVPGVAWVRLGALWTPAPQLFLLNLHAFAPATQRSVACAGDRLLALQSTSLQLQLAADKEALPS
jgi:hypothetical protein